MDALAYGLLHSKHADTLAADREMAKAVRIIAELAAEKDAALANVEKLKRALALEQAHAAGAIAQGKLMKKIGLESDPEHEVFKKTGRVFVKGDATRLNTPEIHLDTVYSEAFDAKCRELGIAKPELLRVRAE